MSDTTCVSCPGKVLLAGGYLVLSPSYQGFVISTPSRFYTVVRPASSTSSTASSEPTNGTESKQKEFRVTVRSPQFSDGVWEYRAFRDGEEGEWEVEQVGSCSRNPFVHLSISSSLLIASAIHPSAIHEDLEITIVGSNDFYSQARSDATPIPFAPLGVPIGEVHKTGLGSSAAMVTSLTSALFLHFTKTLPSIATPPLPQSSSFGASPHQSTRPPNPDKGDMILIHNLAQYVHSLAQGKVGSGFDVSAAVWGSQVYRRFAVECLGDLLEEGGRDKKIKAMDLLKTLSPLYNDKWKTPSTSALVSPFSLPPQTLLVLADVDAGSNTPSMVGKVLAWQKKDSEAAEKIWNELKASNSDLAGSFANLTRLANDDGEKYGEEVQNLSSMRGDQWSKESPYPFLAAREHILSTRSNMRKMGEASGVPIEPVEQTKLLDLLSALPGVIGAGVPGAGGYDAIWVLLLSPDTTTSSLPAPSIQVIETLNSYTEMSVKPLSQNAWAVGGDDDNLRGLLREEVDEVVGLREAVEGRQG